MKNVLIQKLVKTTIVWMFAKLKPAKKTYFAKLFDMCLSVVEIMSQNLKRYVFVIEIFKKKKLGRPVSKTHLHKTIFGTVKKSY